MKKKLQVFISSTYTDLVEERQAAVFALLKAGHIPAGMELFAAGDKSQMKVIEKWIDESDVYMLILGARYGSIEKTSGLSYVELEYDYAIQVGKPVFAVVITEEAIESRLKSIGSASIERENPQLLKAFREKVLSNISSFFSDAKDIKLCVHESLSDFVEDPRVKGWISVDDVEDAKALHDQIKQLKSENERLQAQMTLPATLGKATKDSDKVAEAISILKAKKVKVPATMMATKVEAELSYLHLFDTQRDSFVTGLSNNNAANDLTTFLFFHVVPSLQIYGLVEIQKVPGVLWRRATTTRFGREVLQELDRRRLSQVGAQSKKLDEPKKAAPSDLPPIEDTPVVVAPGVRKPVGKRRSGPTATEK
jgi:hypothetical protein